MSSPLPVSAAVSARLGLGLAALGRPGYMVLGHGEDLGLDKSIEALELRTHEVLDAAWASGVRCFDTARSYGRGEAFLGSWLRSRSVAPDDVFVSSKWGYTYTADWRVDASVHEVKEHTLAVFERQWPQTREWLGPWLDLYQVHSATLSSGIFERVDVLEAMVALRERTGVRLGLSVTGPDQSAIVRRALATRVRGRRVFQAVQATWNLLEPSVGPALAEAHDAGWWVVIKEGMANGRLTSRNPDPDQRARIQAIASGAETTPDALALAAARARPFADLVLSGASRVDHLQSNLAARELPWNASLESAVASLAEDPVAYWARRARLAWV